MTPARRPQAIREGGVLPVLFAPRVPSGSHHAKRAMANAHTDRDSMLRALQLAERGRGRTAPNPVVGAVVVSRGRVVAEGWHAALGAPHAEAMALARADRKRLARPITAFCSCRMVGMFACAAASTAWTMLW